MDADLIGKFITQQVTAEMAEKTKQYEKNIENLEKGGKDRVPGEFKKNGTRGGGRASKKKKINDSDDYKVKNTQEICVSIGTRPKEHPSDPLEGKNPKIRRCRQRYARKQAREESSALEKRIEVNQEDLGNRRRQLARSVKEKARESYGFLPDKRRSENQNALLILTAIEKWFYF